MCPCNIHKTRAQLGKCLQASRLPLLYKVSYIVVGNCGIRYFKHFITTYSKYLLLRNLHHLWSSYHTHVVVYHLIWWLVFDFKKHEDVPRFAREVRDCHHCRYILSVYMRSCCLCCGQRLDSRTRME